MNELEQLLKDILGPPPNGAGQDVTGPLWSTLREAELDRVGIDPAAGGAGGELADTAAILIKTGESCLSVPITETALLAGHLAASTAPLGSGTYSVAFSLPGAEPVHLRRAEDGWRLSGSALAVPWLRQVDVLLVVAETHDDRVAVVEISPAAVSSVPADNIAGETRDDLHFDDLAVADRDVRFLARAAVDDLPFLGALGRSCQLLGAMRTCFEMATSYSLLRKQFGRSIGSRQVVAAQLAELAGEVAATAAGVSAAVDQLGAPGRTLSPHARFAIAAAKVQAARAGTIVAAIAHQVHGAVGMTAEHPLHHATSRLWAWRDEFGTERYWAQQLSVMVADRDLWTLLTEQSSPAGGSA